MRRSLTSIDSRSRCAHVVTTVLATMLTAGCTGLIDEGPEPPTLEELRARQVWSEKTLPVLSTQCTSCHNGSRIGLGFLAGEAALDIRATAVGFAPTVVNLTYPGTSRLLTKGIHDGPELTAQQTSDVLEWVRAERDAQPDVGGDELETAPFVPLVCQAGTPVVSCPMNTIDLTSLGLAGAQIQFVAIAMPSQLYLTQLRLIAGTDGAYIEHPLFVSRPVEADPIPDAIDRFFSVKLNIASGINEMIDGGTASFLGFKGTDEMTIHFRAVKPYQADVGPGGGTMGGGGCKDLASFKLNAQALFAQPAGGAAQSCAGCHLAGSAKSAMDLTGINATTDAEIKQACNQIRTRANLTMPDQSSVFIAPDPANNNHPFKFTAAQLGVFKNGPPGTGVLGWINAEKVAP